MGATTSFVKPMSKRKYRPLFDILSKIIMGYSISLENITVAKLHCMAMIVDKVENINWVGSLKALFLQEHVKFSIDADNNVKLEKKVRNLGKVSVLLKDKLPAFN